MSNIRPFTIPECLIHFIFLPTSLHFEYCNLMIYWRKVKGTKFDTLPSPYTLSAPIYFSQFHIFGFGWNLEIPHWGNEKGATLGLFSIIQYSLYLPTIEYFEHAGSQIDEKHALWERKRGAKFNPLPSYSALNSLHIFNHFLVLYIWYCKFTSKFNTWCEWMERYHKLNFKLPTMCYNVPI